MSRLQSARLARPCTALLALPLLLGATTASAVYFKPRKPFPDGWDAKVEFGAHATSGASRTSSVSGGAVTTFRGGRWEHNVVVKALQSAATVPARRRDANGDPVLDAAGEPVTDVVRKRTNDRRLISLEPRRFLDGDRRYLFAIFDFESNEPADIHHSSRQIAGVGYRYVIDKANWFTAGVGVGRKLLVQGTDEREEGGIGYVGIAFTRLMAERVTFESALDSDFGGENRFTELALGLTWKLEAPVALKIGYEARMNSAISDPKNPFDESVDARGTISLTIDVL